MLIADTHVHFYPSYDAAAALRNAYRNLASFGRADGCDVGLFLTERYDCFFFRGLQSGQISPPSGFAIVPTAEKGALVLENKPERIRVLLFAGRQIVTADGIEVLALTTDDDISDRLPTDVTLDRIRESGAVPVLSWSPGKWLGRRGSIIRKLIEHSSGKHLVLGDTSLRPVGWPTPGLMKVGKSKGLPVLAGSDPLPISGDELAMGRYAIIAENFQVSRPVTSARAMIFSGSFNIVGRRNHFPVMMKRWIKNEQARKGRS